MKENIITIIDKKAMRQYRGMTETKKKAYRAMLYAGAQITLNDYSVREIAPEIGYTESGTSKLVQKWIDLKQKGDITVNLIITAILKLPKGQRYQRKSISAPKVERVIKPAPQVAKVESTPQEKVEEKVIETPIKKEKLKTKNVLGFLLTPEDQMRERAAIRSSILFFQSYGKGRQPRMNGEYFTPGISSCASIKEDGKWLPLDTAALYCGCKEELISAAGQNGVVERRVYRRNANRNYYEYKVEDLDRFIRDNHLV